MNCTIRQIRKDEYPLLRDFLYEAIFIPPGSKAPPETILDAPELQVYISRFGESKDDWGMVAQADGKIIGAVWARIMNDYGHVDDQTPSLAIAVYQQYRGLGIGTKLMEAMLGLLKQSGYARVSLAVQKANRAVKLYEKAGFKTAFEHDEEYIMFHDL